MKKVERMVIYEERKVNLLRMYEDSSLWCVYTYEETKTKLLRRYGDGSTWCVYLKIGRQWNLIRRHEDSYTDTYCTYCIALSEVAVRYMARSLKISLSCCYMGCCFYRTTIVYSFPSLLHRSSGWRDEWATLIRQKSRQEVTIYRYQIK